MNTPQLHAGIWAIAPALYGHILGAETYEHALEIANRLEIPLPAESAVLEAGNARLAEIESQRAQGAQLSSAGISALIDSLENEDYSRPLEPSKVRFGVGLLAHCLLCPESMPVITDAQKASLKRALAGIVAHLS